MSLTMKHLDIGTRLWSLKVEIDGQPPEHAYEIVGNQMLDMLSNIVEGGWAMANAPDVVEYYDPRMDKTTITATLKIKDTR